MQNIKSFLDELTTNPKAIEKLQAKGELKTNEEKLQAILEIGKDLGYELSAEELSEALKEKAAALKERTDAQAEEVETLDDDELATAAGGKKEHSECKDTYRNRENCWVKDGCDVVNIKYSGYVCHLSQQLCDNNQTETLINVITNLIP